jgi:hypothetical protein
MMSRPVPETEIVVPSTFCGGSMAPIPFDLDLSCDDGASRQLCHVTQISPVLGHAKPELNANHESGIGQSHQECFQTERCDAEYLHEYLQNADFGPFLSIEKVAGRCVTLAKGV